MNRDERRPWMVVAGGMIAILSVIFVCAVPVVVVLTVHTARGLMLAVIAIVGFFYCLGSESLDPLADALDRWLQHFAEWDDE